MIFYFSIQFILYFILTELIILSPFAIKSKKRLLLILNLVTLLYLNADVIYLLITILLAQRILENQFKIENRNQIILLVTGYLALKFIFFKEFTALVSFLPLVLILQSVFANKDEDMTKFAFIPLGLSGPLEPINQNKNFAFISKNQTKAYFKLSLGFLIISTGTLFQNYKFNIVIPNVYTYGKYLNDLIFCLNYYYLNFLGTCLIGSAFLNRLGININYYNFNKPFLAWSYKIFWKKWNMTISNFFSNYIYNTLQLNLFSKFKVKNRASIFLLSHGALLITWAYISFWHSTKETIWVWLGYNYSLIVISGYLDSIKNKLTKTILWIINLNLIFIGFIILESNNLKELTVFLKKIIYFDFNETISAIEFLYALISIVIMLIFQYIKAIDIIIRRRTANSNLKTYLILFVMSLISIIIYSNKSVFYYGQF